MTRTQSNTTHSAPATAPRPRSFGRRKTRIPSNQPVSYAPSCAQSTPHPGQQPDTRSRRVPGTAFALPVAPLQELSRRDLEGKAVVRLVGLSLFTVRVNAELEVIGACLRKG